MVRGTSSSRILVTRPEPGAQELATALKARGLEAVVYPTTRLQVFEDMAVLDRALEQIATYDWIVFASTTPLRLIVQRLSALGLAPSHLKGPRLLAGPSTGARLKSLGLNAVIIQPKFSAAAAADYFRAQPMRGKRVLLPGAADGRRELAETLRSLGAIVEELYLYRSQPDLTHGPAILTLIRDGSLAAITLASPSAATGLIAALEAAGEPRPAETLTHIPVICIGRTTAVAAGKVGLRVAVVAEETSAAALADAVASYFERAGSRS